MSVLIVVAVREVAHLPRRWTVRDRNSSDALAPTAGHGRRREARRDEVIRTFSTLLGYTTAPDFDLAEALRRVTDACVRCSGADAVGVLLLDEHGTLRPVAVSDEAGSMAALFAGDEPGPCEAALAKGAVISIPDLAAEAANWPAFAAAALPAGVRAVHALPMRRNGTPAGSLKLLYAHATTLDAEDAGALQTFADIAAVAFLVRDHDAAITQLQAALESRAVIEQAKGVLSAVSPLSPEEAFGAIRSYARNRNLRVRLVAQGLVSGSLPASRVLATHQSER